VAQARRRQPTEERPGQADDADAPQVEAEDLALVHPLLPPGAPSSSPGRSRWASRPGLDEDAATVSEQQLLNGLLCVALWWAPRMTSRFLLPDDAWYRLLHVIVLAVVVVGCGLGFGVAAAAWPVFCAVGGLAFLRRRWSQLRSLEGLASLVPFAFSMVSAVWLVAGQNDLRLLGYTPSWSAYAALHGAVLGWLFVGCLAELGSRPGARRVYVWSCFVVFALFLCVAFGIDGVPVLKRLGVLGLAVVVPGLIARFALDQRSGGAAWRWSLLSLLGIVVTMGLALAHEFQPGVLGTLWGLPTMVVAHGMMNAVVVVPAFFLAVLASSSSSSPPSSSSSPGA